jgi:hypothetical protein
MADMTPDYQHTASSVTRINSLQFGEKLPGFPTTQARELLHGAKGDHRWRKGSLKLGAMRKH